MSTKIWLRSTYVDQRTLFFIWLSFAEHLSSKCCDCPSSKQQELEHARNRVPLRPFEICVGDHCGLIADLQQDCRNRIGNIGAFDAQDSVAVSLPTLHQKILFELRRIGGVNLEKDDSGNSRDMAKTPLCSVLVLIFVTPPPHRAIRVPQSGLCHCGHRFE